MIVGVSRDSLKSHEDFKAKMGFPFELVSDADEKLCKQFDVIKMKNMYGKKVRGIERSTFVVDANGGLAREWRGVGALGSRRRRRPARLCPHFATTASGLSPGPPQVLVFARRPDLGWP